MFTTFCSVEKNIKTLQIYLAQMSKKGNGTVAYPPRLSCSQGRCMALSTAIHWINLYPVDNAITSQILIRRIVIFPLGNAIQLLNNQDHINHYPMDKY